MTRPSKRGKKKRRLHRPPEPPPSGTLDGQAEQPDPCGECLFTVMYITSEIIVFVKIWLESLNCLVRFKILRLITVKSIIFLHVMPSSVLASCHVTRCHMPEDSALETNSMELNA
jgi:hypothetical protein